MCVEGLSFFFFFSSRRRHTRCSRDWSSDVCSSDLEPLARHRVVGAALAEIDDRPVLPLGIFYHVGHVEHLRLERARWREELEQIVPLLSGDLGVGARPEIGEGDVVDRHLDPLGRPPVFRVLVEPHVVGGNEVAPLEDLEGLLGPLDPNRRPQSGGHGDSGRRGHEFTPIDALTLGHCNALRCGCGVVGYGVVGYGVAGYGVAGYVVAGDRVQRLIRQRLTRQRSFGNASPGLSHNVYSTLNATWSALAGPVLYRVTERKYSRQTA